MNKFTEEQFFIKFNKIYRNLTNNKLKSRNKKAFILGGQPGAGKSGLTTLIEKNYDVIVINGDEFRKYHPNYRLLEEKYGIDSVLYTGKFSGRVTETLINKLSDEGYNLVIEGTLRTSDIPVKTCELLKKKGYEVDLDLVLVRPEISLLGTFQRYADMLKLKSIARATPVEHHNTVVKNIPQNLDVIYKKNIFDNIEIFDRKGTKLYSKKDTPYINPKNIFDKEFNRRLSNDEIKKINDSYSKVINVVEKYKDSTSILGILKEEKSKLPKPSRWINRSDSELER